jgi:integrase
MWYSFCKDHGWLNANRRPTVSPHQFRHAYATMLFEADIPEMDAKDVMGHSSIQVPRDVYTHIREKRRAESAGKLNAYLNGTCHDPVNPAEVIEINRNR